MIYIPCRHALNTFLGLFGLLLLLSFPDSSSAEIVDFEELNLSPNSFFDGYGDSAQAGGWTSGPATFNTNLFGPGWSYSNVNDTTTAGFTNQWAAYSGTGYGGSGNYAMANSFDPDGAYINFSGPLFVDDVQVTNGTYTGLSMRDGDGFGKQFGGTTGNDPDFFSVTFTGFSGLDKAGSETGSVTFFLADYRFSDNRLDYILSDWATVDLSGLGAVQSIAITLVSSDNNAFGMNTPAYFAMDHLRWRAVPEPTSMGTVLAFLTMVGIRRRRRAAYGF